MKTQATAMTDARRVQEAFSLIEVLVGVLVTMIMFTSLYLGFAQGVGIIQLARENLRATQVLEEKTETLRLYTWEQVNSNGFIPTNFVAPFYAVGSQQAGDFSYYGTLTIAPVDLPEASYDNDLRLITVQVVWTNGNVPRIREMQTMIGKNALQRYVY